MKLKYLLGLALAITVLFSANKASAQLSSCDGTVPYYFVDLTGQPAGTWLSPPHKRNGSCCGEPANCTSFEVLLDSNAAALSFQFYSGAVPSGSLAYEIDCGGSVPVGAPICISGVGPHKITFCKPGSNTNEYLITSIAKPTFPQDDSTRNGCSKKIEVLGLEQSTVTWQSVFPGAPGAYDFLLSCTSNCTETFFTPQLTSPPYVDYVVCGFPQADECGYVLSLCDTFRIYTVGALTGNVSPNPAGFCQLGPGSGVTLTAQGVGGNNVYNYTWYNNLNNVVGTGPTYFATSQQTYTVEIKDGLSSTTCGSYFTSVPVLQTSQPTANAGTNQLVCPDIAQVQLVGTVNFATGGIWTGGSGTFSPSNTSLTCSYSPTPAEIASGSLSLYLTTTGAGGSCSNVTDTIVITFPDFIKINLSDTLLKCSESNAILTPIVTGGVTPYSYIWSNGTSQTTATVGEGITCLTIVDDLGCSKDTCVTVSVPAELELLMSSTPASSNGGNDGTATASPTGGTLPYNYLWSPSGNTSTINGLSYGIYNVTVIDGNNCSVQGSVVVSEPRCLSFSVSTTVDTLLCYGDASSTAIAHPVGGTAPYVYVWDDLSSSTTQSITNLTGGLYSVVVSDSNNCLAVSTANVVEPSQLVNSIFATNASTVGGTDGSATANTFGGVAPYTYSWSTIPVQTTPMATGLSAGIYYVTITDKNNCSITDSVLINEPPCNNYLLYVSGTNLSCNGSNDGTANVVIVGGTAPYNIQWSSGQSSFAVNGLSANTYSVSVTDAANCYSFKNITITQPNVLQASANLINNISCFGTNDGTVDLVVVGGTYPYSYLWSNGSTAEDLIHLSQGGYSVLVTDKNGCTTNDAVTITQPSVLSSTFTKQNVTCFEDSTGSINVTPIGGTFPYTYIWSNGATTEDVNNLAAGLYNYTVYDANNCNSALAASILITEPDLVVLDSFYVPCPIPGSGNSVVEFYPIGGTSAYQISSDNGLTYAPFNQYNIAIPSGSTYHIMVRDTNGCLSLGMDSIVINPSVVIDSVSFEKCFATTQNMSNVEVFVSGGDGGLYQVSYDGGLFNTAGDYNDSLSINGTHSIVAQDGLGCLSLPYTINVPDRLLASSAITSNYNGNDVSCNGSTDGTALASATGGQTPYSYLWSNTQVTALASGLGAGTYQVTITDANGCSEQSQVTLSEPDSLLASVVVSSNYNGKDISCYGASDGSIDLTVVGGTMPYDYLWSNSETTEDISLLGAGTYQVQVIDVNGCSDVITITLTQPDTILLSSVITHVKCNSYTDGGIDLTVVGGVTPYQFSWSTTDITEDISNIGVGVYNVNVTDINNCVVSASYTVNEESPIVITSLPEQVTCYNQSNGIISTGVTGGVQPYSYSWNTGETAASLDSLNIGTYILTVTDSNNCFKHDTIVITQPDSLYATIDSELNPNGHHISLFQMQDGSIELEVFGGTTPYQYNWSNGVTTEDIQNVGAGEYSVTITDEKGCVYTTKITLTEPFDLEMPTVITPNGDGNNDFFVVHGIESYPVNTIIIFNRWGDEVYSMNNYNNKWQGESNSGSNLPAGNYFVILKINNGAKVLTGYCEILR